MMKNVTQVIALIMKIQNFGRENCQRKKLNRLKIAGFVMTSLASSYITVEEVVKAVELSSGELLKNRDSKLKPTTVKVVLIEIVTKYIITII